MIRVHVRTRERPTDGMSVGRLSRYTRKEQSDSEVCSIPKYEDASAVIAPVVIGARKPIHSPDNTNGAQKKGLV